MGWAALMVLALLIGVGTLIGVGAYNAGVSHGLALGAQVAVERAAAPAAGAQGAPAVVPVPMYGHGYYGYGWHPWGGGFIGPIFFLLFWFFILRMFLWRGMFWGGWGGRGGCGPRGYWRHRGYGRYDDDYRHGPTAQL